MGPLMLAHRTLDEWHMALEVLLARLSQAGVGGSGIGGRATAGSVALGACWERPP